MSAFHLEKPSLAWSGADLSLIIWLWNEGHSASQISKRLANHHSRNSVLGKIDRLRKEGKIERKVLTRSAQNDADAARKTVRKPKPAIAIKPREFRDMDRPGILTAGESRDTSKLFSGPTWEPLPGSNPVLLELRKGCAWPLGESPFTFCNLDVNGEGQVYCATHQGHAYQRRAE